MIQQNFASSQSFQNCEAHKERLIQEIQQLTVELKNTSEVNKYTAKIKKKMARIETKIRSNQDDLEKVKVMLTFVPGDWVRNGTTRPGQITELRIVGRIPEVQVLWWNNTASVPENPRHLKLVEPDDLRYIWNGERYPKLIRSLDHLECEDLEILNQTYRELESFQETLRPAQGNAEEINLKKVYCRKRLKLLQTENSLLSQTQENKLYSFCQRKPELKTISIEDINRRSGKTQQRIALNPEIVTEYSEAMLDGAIFPPVTLKYDGENYWLVDGFHTTEAAWSIGKTEISAFVSIGDLREAILDSVGVNASHGLRRTNADKRRAVTTLLEDEEWGKWSNVKIAKTCKVSESLIRTIKNENPSLRLNEVTYLDKYGNTSSMEVENLGSKGVEDIQVDNPKSDNSIITSFKRGDNPKEYINESQMSLRKESPFQEKPTSAENKIAQKMVTERSRSMAHFKIGQIVVIDSDRSDQRLVGYNSSCAVITGINLFSVDIKVWGKIFTEVAPQDLKEVLSWGTETLNLCHSLNTDKMAFLMSKFDAPDQIIEYVLVTQGYEGI